MIPKNKIAAVKKALEIYFGADEFENIKQSARIIQAIFLHALNSSARTNNT